MKNRTQSNHHSLQSNIPNLFILQVASSKDQIIATLISELKEEE